jgi:hypothetical protein
MPDRKRVALVVWVDLDPVPGAFHEPVNARNHVQALLNLSVPHYNPRVLIDHSLSNQEPL